MRNDEINQLITPEELLMNVQADAAYKIDPYPSEAPQDRAEGVRRAAEQFYVKAVQDPHLKLFIRDSKERHGGRMGDWLVEKLELEVSPWTDELATRNAPLVELANGKTHRVVDRTSAHVAAWHSIHREKEKVGRRFKVDDCRIWMRLMFWSLREQGLLQDRRFEQQILGLIEHFIGVYERTAPYYATESMLWSANPENIEQYLRNGRVMNL